MKNKLLLNIIRKTKKNYKRFISLLFLSFLGVGFYAGIGAAGPAILNTVDNFYDKSNTYDIEIVSNLGLTDNDIKGIKKSDLINGVYGVKYTDEFIDLNKESLVAKIIEYNDKINTPTLLDGNLPKSKNEIVVEEKLLTENYLKIGDFIKIKEKSYKIVGTVVSPLYFSLTRESTTLGDGKISYYIYVYKDTLAQDYYNSIYVTINDNDLKTSSKEYKDLVEDAKDEIKKIQNIREEERYQELYKDYFDYAKLYNLSIDESTLTRPKWYIFDRTNISAYNEIIDASTNMNKISNIFPLVFFIIAILVSLISMLRMVEEDRSENGTLKALGFSNNSICMNYFLYSILATVIGGVLGFIFCVFFFPNIIWSIYKTLFNIPEFIISFDLLSGLLGLIASIICICGTAIFVAYKNLKDAPAILMRPKAPKKAKRLLLEHIPFIWRKIKFSNKIVIRNIFRYKSRVLATIIGIAGCTALILSGFGLKDSMQDIAEYQFNKIFKYNEMINIKEDNQELISKIKSIDNVNHLVEGNISTITLKNNSIKKEATMIVPENQNKLKNVISLIDTKTKEEIQLKNNEIVISEKLAKLLEIEKDDEIIISNSNDVQQKIKVSNIVENYIDLYVYINKETYNNIFKNYNTNVLFLTFDKKDNKKIDKFNKEILSNKEITNIIITDDIINSVLDMMDSLNSVVIILIIAAAILAFVVLYNLSNINICERQREIATLKVLGFYDKEVDDYITKENIILTALGIPIGLILGYYLTQFMISTCEQDTLMYTKGIKLLSYIISSLITIIFTIIINIINHHNLKKIDMIESLKNVE